MKKVKLIFLFILLVFVGMTKANAQQEVSKLDSVLNKLLDKYLKSNLQKLKDSNNLYYFAIKINLTRVNSTRLRLDSISTNDAVYSKVLFGDLNKIKDINFNNYVKGSKKIKIIKPISILIGQKAKPNFTTEDIYNQNCKLFYLDKTNVWQRDFYFESVLLPPLISSFDLSIY